MMAIAPSQVARRGPTGRSVASTPRRRARTWAGSVEATDRARTNANGERDEAVPLAEKLYVLVLDLYVWFCD